MSEPSRRSATRPAFRHASFVASSVLVALVLVASGCGGGSDSSSDDDTLSLPSWKKQVNTLCAAARKDVDTIDTPTETTAYADWETAGLAVKKRINTFIDDVDKLGAPSSDATKTRAFMDQWRAYTGDFDALVTAAKAEDSAQVEEALTTLQASNDKKDALAKGLGLDECYRADGGDPDSEPTDTLSKDTTTTTVDESASGENLPPAEWSAKVDAACTALGSKYSTLGSADPQTVEEAQQVADDLSAFASELVAEWDRIGPPAGDTTQAQQLYDLFVRFSEIAVEFQDAVAATDTAAIEQATTDLDQVTTEMAPLAIALNVPSCGST